ncbi:MAG TPA: hemolysin family protein [Dehalococcoidia bacterium]|nr:hemolysin family protein [Dehalococcoidia bacterium]
MDASSWIALALLIACLALMVFVAAAEAGLISISRARVRLMAGQGIPNAEVLHSYVQERESLLRALSLARNLAIVGAAALAATILTRDYGNDWLLIVAVIIAALALLALLEALPRALVARSPERWGLRMAPLMGAFKLLFGGIAHVLDLPARAFARKHEEEEGELMRLMELEENEGDLEEDERKMIRGVFGLEDTAVREIMTPRLDIAALEADAIAQDAVKLIVERGFSRLPIYEDNLDSIVGIVYAKDLIRSLAEGTTPPTLREIARTPFFVPDSKRVDDLLTDMRKQRTHIAIVVDEYGGTAGLVTIEDLLEEIVGEIEDEHDPAQQPIVRVSDTEMIVDGRITIDDLNELFHTSIDAEDFDTVGGCVVHLLGRMPAAGDEAMTDGLKLSVLSVDGHRVKRLRVTQIEKPSALGENGNGSGK